MNIIKEPPTPDELAAIYIEAGWLQDPFSDKMTKAVSSPSEWYVVRDLTHATLGIGRFITDYARCAFIVDVIVLKIHHHKGIGTAIISEIVSDCRKLGIDNINLWPSKGKLPFYEKLGFYSLPSDQPHMKFDTGK
ncbi:GNAT family N-acetyltransferase [uncultured Microbulbifer sp.]|uniref:GNAT family N-acetyltransferase n=1 Tax=uncultured Microbulbifer sp. TaxID=348147 RepID=UPI00262DAA3A|nr:GNAT family N-acetyltransferase [uncultured Microbulbifer sp.]